MQKKEKKVNDDEHQDEELQAAGHSGQGLAVTLHSRLSWWQTLLLAFSVTHTHTGEHTTLVNRHSARSLLVNRIELHRH